MQENCFALYKRCVDTFDFLEKSSLFVNVFDDAVVHSTFAAGHLFFYVFLVMLCFYVNKRFLLPFSPKILAF